MIRPIRITAEYTRIYDRRTGNCDSVLVYTFYWPDGRVTSSDSLPNGWVVS